MKKLSAIAFLLIITSVILFNLSIKKRGFYLNNCKTSRTDVEAVEKFNFNKCPIQKYSYGGVRTNVETTCGTGTSYRGFTNTEVKESVFSSLASTQDLEILKVTSLPTIDDSEYFKDLKMYNCKDIKLKAAKVYKCEESQSTSILTGNYTRKVLSFSIDGYSNYISKGIIIHNGNIIEITEVTKSPIDGVNRIESLNKCIVNEVGIF
ncbi:MAG: hypothetical protein AAB443_04625 [Patescibacteria group bacterium]